MKESKEYVYCKKCVYPQSSVNINIDEEGVCSACRVAVKFEALTPEFWEQRKQRFASIVKEITANNKGNYDCLIPVSGGKDSYYQTHLIAKEFGLKPLLMTYHGNNYLPEGDFNRDRMKHVF